jgi:hypothetical protein
VSDPFNSYLKSYLPGGSRVAIDGWRTRNNGFRRQKVT